MTVILANGAPPTHPVPLRLFREADRLIACDGAWRKVLDLGRTPDAVVGDGDSLGADGREALAQRGIPFIGEEEQETNDLCKAFRHAVATGAEGDAVVILGATGRREDHALGNIFHLLDFAAEVPRNGGEGADRLPVRVSMVTDSGTFEPVLPPGGAWNAGCRFADRCEKCTDRCRQAMPALTEVAPGHRCRCFLHSEEVEQA